MKASGMVNYFQEFHPVSLLLYYVLLGAAIFACGYTSYTVCIFISLSLCSMVLKGMKAYIKAFAGYVFLTAVISVFNVIFNHSGNNVFLYVNDVPLTLDALLYGVYTGLFVCSLLLWFSTFNQSMNSSRINYLIGSRLKAVGLILSMSFGFMDKFRYKLDIIRQTLYTQGYTAVNLRYGATVLSLLLSVMLEDSSVAADSMTARGYMCGKRRIYRRYAYRAGDSALIAASALLCVMSVLFKPIIIIFAIIPVIYTIYKELLWKYYQSKI